MTSKLWAAALCITGMLAAGLALAAPLGTGFTYQGQLNQGGVPVNGAVNLRFGLYDAATSGANLGARQILTGVPVANGLFTVQLNGSGQFGASAFSGDARWLEVEVCTDPGCSSSTVLSPRQALTATPYALTAAKPWNISGSNISFSGGHVGIGTASPQGPLDVASGAGSFVRVDATNGDVHFNGGVDGAFGLYNESGAAGGTYIVGQNALRLTVLNTGNVGIGTATPAAALEVRGDVKLGATGQYLTGGGEENLRMIRGTIGPSGNVLQGAGFSVYHGTLGIYDIAFFGAFPNAPTITATVEYTSGTPLFAMNMGVYAGGVRVLLINHAGSPAEGTIHFTAVGSK